MKHYHAKDYLKEIVDNKSTEGWLKDLIITVINNNGDYDKNDILRTISQLENNSNSILSLSTTRFIESDSTIQLVSLLHKQGVCALEENQEIKFSKGITLITGENGSGKSSYFKILHDLIKNDEKSDIICNIYKENVPENYADAELKYIENKQNKIINWKDRGNVQNALMNCPIFDSHYTNKFLDKRSIDSAIVKPYGFYLFDSILKYFEEVNKELSNKEQKIENNIPQIKTENLSDKIKSLFENRVYTKEDKQYILENREFTKEDKEALFKIENEIKEEKRTNYQDKIDTEKRNLKIVQNFDQSIESYIETIKKYETEAKSIINSIEKIQEKEQKIKKELEILESLELTNSKEWKEFIEAGEKFSNHSHISTDICPYCRQKLTPYASEIIKGYHSFLENRSQKELNKLKDNKNLLMRKIDSLSTDSFTKDHMIEVFSESSKIPTSDIKPTVLKLNDIKIKLYEYLNNKFYGEIFAEIDYCNLMTAVKKSKTDIDDKISVLKSNQNIQNNRISELHEKALIYKERESISSQINSINRWFNCIDNLGFIQGIKKRINTKTITECSKKAHRDLITENLKKQFIEELAEIGFGHLEVVLENANAKKGQNFIELKLNIKNETLKGKNINIKNVLSEGEQKGVALALFLAERTMQKELNVPFILDDPVNSLDNQIIINFVNRLGRFDNQIIIFSHSILLEAAVNDLSHSHKCNLADILTCKKNGKHVITYLLSWISKDKKGHVELKSQINAKYFLDNAEQLFNQKDFCSDDIDCVSVKLRKCIEYSVDEVVLNGQIPQRYKSKKTSIKWNELKNLNSDSELIDNLKTHYSRLSGGNIHSGMEQTENPITKYEVCTIINYLKEILHKHYNKNNK